MDIYEEIRQENMEILLTTLTEGILKGKKQWYDMKYNSISFMQEGEKGKEAYICHSFEMKTKLNGRVYDLELSENINLPSEKGDIFGAIFFENEDGENKYDFALSYETEYEECFPKEIGEHFSDSVVLKLAEAVMVMFEGTEAERFGFSFARFFNQNGIKDKWKRAPLVKLSKRLMEEKRLRDFHRIILDVDYRETLLKSENIV